MKILVIGGTGTVGSEVVRCLAGVGAPVVLLTRTLAKLSSLPPGTEGRVGDLGKPDSLGPVFAGIESVFLLNAVTPDETDQGLVAVEAARNASVRRIVYMSVHKVEEARHIPHFGTKIPVEKAVRESGLEWTILRPNNFFQNDIAYREAIVRNGIYPHPFGNVGLSRVDVRDIADCAVAALLGPGASQRTVSVIGPDVLKAEETARIWGLQLEQAVRYGGDDLESWAASLKGFVPDWLLGDLQIMYNYFQSEGLIGTARELDEQEQLMGHPARSFDAFVAELAPIWKIASATA